MGPGDSSEGFLDLYCERTGTGLWAEPLNALTNLAFFTAAWKLIPNSEKGASPLTLLIALIVSIGIGSTLFHTFATTWAQLLDVTPILLFQVCFVWLYSRRIIHLSRLASALILSGFLIAAFSGRLFPEVLNRSLSYVPGLLVLIIFGSYHHLTRKQAHLALLGASAIFLISVTFRSVDLVLCAYVPFGTHFLWHILNGAVLYLAVKALVLNWQGGAVHT